MLLGAEHADLRLTVPLVLLWQLLLVMELATAPIRLTSLFLLMVLDIALLVDINV